LAGGTGADAPGLVLTNSSGSSITYTVQWRSIA
jgi:hypothetical protein